MNAKVNDDKIQYMQKFQNAQEKIIQTFAEIMEAKSGETGQHVRRVAEYSEAIASQMDENNDYRDYLRVASMMHDVGKLMIPIAILEKPGPLTDLEFQMMMTHTNYGDSLLSHSDGKIMDIARSIAYEHHERWDGKGYPRGLRGNQISIYAQIVSVADVYDALTSNRAYKEAWDPEEAKKEILRQSGKQFSPSVVDAFIGCYDKIEEIRRANADA
jgi:response regulator RpfG family c-di-GMP phosphodiesterase